MRVGVWIHGVLVDFVTVVRSIRAGQAEWDLWASTAGAVGAKSLNAWLRQAANDQAELDLAILREGHGEEADQD